MRSCRLRWPAGFPHAAMRQRTSATSDCKLLPTQAIWNQALASASAIITKDEDFAQRKAMAGSGPAVVWIRQPNMRRRDLLVWFEKVLPAILAALARGEMLIEVT